MKRLLTIAFSLLLIIACQKAENILEIVPGAPDGTGAGNLPTVTNINPGNMQQLTDQNSTVAGIQGLIRVTFSDFMDEATLTEGNIVIKSISTGAEIPTADITTEYYPEIKQLFIYVDDVPDSNAFLLRLVSGGMTNTYGSPIDFDGDNYADGSPYDDYHSNFYTVNNTDPFVYFDQPTVTSVSPESTAVNNQQPLITVIFNMNMDTLTLNTTNITLENESGTSQSLDSVLTVPDTIIVQPTNPLSMYDNYIITVHCANIERPAASTYTPSYFVVVDGNNDGPEASEPNLEVFFRVDDQSPPTVSVAAITGGATFTFSDLIDESTITSATVRVIDDIGYVPGEFRIYTNAGNTYTMVDYYYKRAASGTEWGFVSKDVQAENGYYLDGDGNGIGGEPWDDFYDSF